MFWRKKKTDDQLFLVSWTNKKWINGDSSPTVTVTNSTYKNINFKSTQSLFKGRMQTFPRVSCIFMYISWREDSNPRKRNSEAHNKNLFKELMERKLKKKKFFSSLKRENNNLIISDNIVSHPFHLICEDRVPRGNWRTCLDSWAYTCTVRNVALKIDYVQ